MDWITFRKFSIKPQSEEPSSLERHKLFLFHPSFLGGCSLYINCICYCFQDSEDLGVFLMIFFFFKLLSLCLVDFSICGDVIKFVNQSFFFAVE